MAEALSAAPGEALMEVLLWALKSEPNSPPAARMPLAGAGRRAHAPG